MSRLGACLLLKIDAIRKTELKDLNRSVEKIIAGPNHRINMGRWTRKWNFAFVSKILGAHCEVILRKSSIVRNRLACGHDLYQH